MSNKLIQEQIITELLSTINTDAFKRKGIDTLINNETSVKCPECGSNNINVKSQQTRSADEATTKFYTCLDCKYRWRIN